MKVRTLFVAACCFTFSQMSVAMPPKPDACPKASVLIAGGFARVEKTSEGLDYFTVNKSRYNTSEQWEFIMPISHASTKEEALKIAMDVLPSLRDYNNQSPVPIEDLNVWGCMYGVKEGYTALTFSPEMPMPMSKAASS